VSVYFDEHVEADAVHEQLAFREICGTMAEERPEVLNDLFFGAVAYLFSESVAGQAMLDAWAAGGTSLRELPEERGEADAGELETAVAS
jgi:hypothetical protein